MSNAGNPLNVTVAESELPNCKSVAMVGLQTGALLDRANLDQDIAFKGFKVGPKLKVIHVETFDRPLISYKFNNCCIK